MPESTPTDASSDQPGPAADGPRPQPIAPPQYSHDRRWWWTGYEWVPAPQQQPYRAPASNSGIMWSIVGALVIFSVIVLFVYAAWRDHQENERINQDVNDYACQTYNVCGNN